MSNPDNKTVDTKMEKTFDECYNVGIDHAIKIVDTFFVTWDLLANYDEAVETKAKIIFQLEQLKKKP